MKTKQNKIHFHYMEDQDINDYLNKETKRKGEWVRNATRDKYNKELKNKGK